MAVAPNASPTIIFQDNFETGNLSKWGAGCSDRITTQTVHSGTYAFQYDGWPGCGQFFPQSTREAYLSFWWYFPPGFPGGFAPGRHFWRLTYGTAGQSQIQQIDTQAAGTPNGMDVVFLLNGNGPLINGPQLPIGRWFKFDFYVRLNDIGAANGETAMWIDGVQAFRRTNVNLNADQNLNMLLITTNYGGCGATCWFVDDVKVWNGCPAGESCSGVKPPATLSPPTNLKVQ
ncbi:MAG: polysaccharide lyase [Nitrososphaera sp.]|nr:polysaccharide lyase [Nitrososphaera sp.]